MLASIALTAADPSGLVAGRPVETAELVVSLRTFIRDVLDLDPVPVELVIPKQGPLRPGASGSRRGGRSEGGSGKGGTGGRVGQGGDGAGMGGAGLAGSLDTDG